MRLYKKLLTYILAGTVATTSLPAYATEVAQASETAYAAEELKNSETVYSTGKEQISENVYALGTVDGDDTVIEEVETRHEDTDTTGIDCDNAASQTTFDNAASQTNLDRGTSQTTFDNDTDTVNNGMTVVSGTTDEVCADQSDYETTGAIPDHSVYDACEHISDNIPYDRIDPEIIEMITDGSASSDHDLFEEGGVEAVNDANIDMPDPDELLEGYLETQIYEETGDEEALKGYDAVIDIEDISDGEEGRNSLTFDVIADTVPLEDGFGRSEDIMSAASGVNQLFSVFGAGDTDCVEPLFSKRRDNLDDLNPIYTRCYDVIKEGASAVASGEESLGRFRVYFKDMGIQTRFTAKELGVDHIAVYSYKCDNPECGHISQGKKPPLQCEECGGDSFSQLFDYVCSSCGTVHRQTTKPDKCSKCGKTSFSKSSLQFSEDAKASATKILRSQSALVAPQYSKVPGEEEGTWKYIPEDSIDSALFIDEGTDMDALKEQYQKNRFTLLYSLLADIPYELYWFNKVTGWTVTASWAYGGDTEAIDCGNSAITFWLPPVPEYKDKESESNYACDTTLTSAASMVIPKARSIVEDASAACVTDYDKLLYYKRVIQDELAPNYNSAATSGWEGKYGNPWQLIWVFDEDPETNVVCEGYSKAFKLLCDLSDFDYEGFDCYLISGYLNRSGNGHMWNSVAMDDGYNYMVDITNTRRSGGTENLNLFMKGASSWNGTWYTYPNGSKYSYKDGSTYVFSGEELTMSMEDYTGALKITLDAPPAEGYVYDGRPIVPAVKDVISTKDRHSLIENNEPFELGYLDNNGTDAGVRYVYAYDRTDENNPDKRNYGNTEAFTISPGNIDELCEVSDTCAQAYVDDKTVETRISVVNRNTGNELISGRDYTVEYDGTKNLGTYMIRVDGTGNYTSSIEKVVNMVITSDTIQVRLKGEGEDEWGEVKNVTYSYTGEEIMPEVILTNLATGNPLVDKKDYTLSYSNNINAGTANVIITGKGIYTSTSVCDFKISPLDINDESIYAEDHVSVEWKGKNLTPNPFISHIGKTMNKGSDYTVTYFESGMSETDSITAITEPGRYVMRIRGKGNFDPGTFRDVELYVFNSSEENELKSVSSLNIDPIPDQKYSEKAGIPQEILPGERGLVIVRDPDKSGPLVPYSEDEENESHTVYDYKITYAHNSGVGTGYAIITGNEANGYTGQVSIPFKINGLSITTARVDGLSRLTLNDSVYTGREVTLEDAADKRVSVSVNGTVLRYYNEETGIGDYTMTYENNTNAGTATVYFVGKNGYVGTLKKTFKITQRSIAENYPDSKIKATIVSCIDNDGARYATAEYMKGGAKPEVIVREYDENNKVVKTLKESVDYTLSYSNNKKLNISDPVGKVTVKGTGNYKGTLTDNFYITKGILKTSVELYAPDITVTPGKEKSDNYKSKVTVTGLDGKKLTSGTDYTLHYYKAVPDGAEDTGAVELTYDHKTAQGKFVCETVKVVPLAKNDKVTAGDAVYITIEAFDKKNNPAIRYEDRIEDISGDTTENTGEDPDDDPKTESDEENAEYRFGRTIYRYDVLDTSNDISKGVFKIAVKDYSGAAVTLNPSDFTDARLNSKSTVQLVPGNYDPDNMTYDDNCDFVIIGYANNIKKGTAKVTVRGVNSYSGTKTVSFKIGSKRFIWW